MNKKKQKEKLDDNQKRSSVFINITQVKVSAK